MKGQICIQFVILDP